MNLALQEAIIFGMAALDPCSAGCSSLFIALWKKNLLRASDHEAARVEFAANLIFLEVSGQIKAQEPDSDRYFLTLSGRERANSLLAKVGLDICTLQKEIRDGVEEALRDFSLAGEVGHA